LLRPERRSRAVSENRGGQAGISILLTGIGRQNAEKSLREFLNSCRSRGDETQIKKELETPHVVSYKNYRPVRACGLKTTAVV
jgi:hypothetical protein